MEIINFNSVEFNGFKENEEILLDTGIILGYLNKYDTWHDTLKNLFDNYIFNNDKTLFLCVNPCIINEVTFLSEKPLEQYIRKHRKEVIPQDEIAATKCKTLNSLKDFIDNEIFIVLDGDKSSVLNQIKLCEKLGDADALNASIANEYGINFLTVDNRLVNNMKSSEEHLSNISKIYYTDSKFKSY